ncbi:hypothetical protein [Nocardia gipuzkoensis]
MTAILPDGNYLPSPAQTADAPSLVVAFHGEDGRRKDFDISTLPLPEWHLALAAAFTERVGPTGTIRTVSSAQSQWSVLSRFVRFLAALPEPPLTVSALTIEQADAFRKHRIARVGDAGWMDFRSIALLMRNHDIGDLLATEVRDHLSRRQDSWHLSSKPGYSDRELNALVRAARADVEAIRQRIRAGWDLVALYQRNPNDVPAEKRSLAEQLATIAVTGRVPQVAGFRRLTARRDLAQHLFLTRRDLCPLMVLMVAITGRNIETIKELPAHHRVIEGRAVELRTVKRRRGPHLWHTTVSWEIGDAGRELHTPGGLYLLVHQLTAPGRALVDSSDRLWATWRNAVGTNTVGGIDEHHNPFGKALNHTDFYGPRWIATHGLTVDSTDDGDRPPLSVDFTRIKTSIDVRHTRRMGGHLPSSARTNSVPVLFSHYLRGDPTVIDWAQEIVSDALADAEQSALEAHRRALGKAGGALRVISSAPDTDLTGRAQDPVDADGSAPHTPTEAAWTTCIDPAHHPVTEKACRANFLDCFHCGNCVVTAHHLPRLLSLLDALSTRRQQLSDSDWWQRYGPTWAAIRHDILVKFTPAEIELAATTKPDDALLDLVEHPWQRP